MELSIREARAQFSKAIEAAQRGERVVITKNGEPVAEIGPAKKQRLNWEALREYQQEMGWDKLDLKPEDLWPPHFDDPDFSLHVLGLDRDDDEDWLK